MLEQLGLLSYALCKRPDDDFLHSHIGRVYYALALLPQATTHLDIAIKANSENPSAYFHRGLIYQKQECVSECAALLEHAVTLSDNADYRLTLIRVLMQLHRFDDAINHSNHGFKKHPQDTRFARAKANALIANKSYELALSWCNKQDAAGTDPTWPLLRYQIHTSLNNDTQAAIEHQEKTRRQIHTHPDYRNKAIEVLESITDATLQNQIIHLWNSKLGKIANYP